MASLICLFGGAIAPVLHHSIGVIARHKLENTCCWHWLSAITGGAIGTVLGCWTMLLVSNSQSTLLPIAAIVTLAMVGAYRDHDTVTHLRGR